MSPVGELTTLDSSLLSDAEVESDLSRLRGLVNSIEMEFTSSLLSRVNGESLLSVIVQPREEEINVDDEEEGEEPDDEIRSLLPLLIVSDDNKILQSLLSLVFDNLLLLLETRSTTSFSSVAIDKIVPFASRFI